MKKLARAIMNVFKKKTKIPTETPLTDYAIATSSEEVISNIYKDVTVLLDPGHGGNIDGVYQTKGKRSPVWEDNTQYFEGVGNREIVKGIARKLNALGINAINLVPEDKDVNLTERVERANKYNEEKNDTIFVSIHSNAGGGTGFESFSLRKTGSSSEMNSIIYDEFIKEFPDEKVRYGDNGKGKTANYKVLRETNMPAVLTESFFMDTEHDCVDILMTKKGLKKIINFHVNAIKRILLKDDA
jgi:N-acetylmuramoyl-L-alanine amidase